MYIYNYILMHATKVKTRLEIPALVLHRNPAVVLWGPTALQEAVSNMVRSRLLTGSWLKLRWTDSMDTSQKRQQKQFNPSQPKKRLEDKNFCGLLASLWRFALYAGCVGKTGCMWDFFQIIGTRLEHEAKLRDFHLKVVPGPHWQHGNMDICTHMGQQFLEQYSSSLSSMQFKGADGSKKHSRTSCSLHRLPSGDSAQRSDRICCDPSGVEMRDDERWGDQSEISRRSNVKGCWGQGIVKLWAATHANIPVHWHTTSPLCKKSCNLTVFWAQMPWHIVTQSELQKASLAHFRPPKSLREKSSPSLRHKVRPGISRFDLIDMTKRLC